MYGNKSLLLLLLLLLTIILQCYVLFIWRDNWGKNKSEYSSFTAYQLFMQMH